MIKRISNIGVLLYSILFFITRTAAGELLGGWTLRFEYLLGLLITATTIYGFFNLDGIEKKKWLKRRAFVFAYFVVRTVSVLFNGYSIALLRTVFFEGVFLLSLSELSIDVSFLKKYIFNFFVGYNLLINIANAAFLLLTGYSDGAPIRFEALHGFLEKHFFKYPFMLYDNENYVGMITGFCMLLVCAYLLEEREKNLSKTAKAALFIYFSFSFGCMIVSSSRTAIVALILALIIQGINAATFRIKPYRVAMACFIIMIAMNCGILRFIHTHIDTGMSFPNNIGHSYTETEEKINSLLSQRYSIWKNGYYAFRLYDYELLGIGNLGTEEDARYAAAEEYFMNTKGVYVPLNYHHPHNGYFAMLFCTGILGTVLYGTFLLLKIRRATLLQSGWWYTCLIYVLFINNLECITILQRVPLIAAVVLIIAHETYGEEEKKHA